MNGPIRHRGYILRKHGRRWRWQVRLEGAWHSESFDSLDAAKKGLDDFLDRRDRQRARSRVRASGGRTVRELVEAWFAEKDPELARSTAYLYRHHVRKDIVPGLGHLDAEAILPRDLRGWYRTCLWSVARRCSIILRMAFTWALEEELLARTDNPTLLARPKRRLCVDWTDDQVDDEREVKPVDEKEIFKTWEIEILKGDALERGKRRWWLLLMIAPAVGTRPSETGALQRKDFDLDRLRLSIRRSASRLSGGLKAPKTPWSVRTLPISQELADVIAPFLPEDPEAFLFPANGHNGGKPSLLPCWDANMIRKQLNKALTRTGLPHYTPHAFRHYFATYLLAEGVAPLQVARYLGHKNDQLVRELYGHHIHDESFEEIARLATRSLSSRKTKTRGSDVAAARLAAGHERPVRAKLAPRGGQGGGRRRPRPR